MGGITQERIMAKKTTKADAVDAEVVVEDQFPDGVDPQKVPPRISMRGTEHRGPNKKAGEKGPNIWPRKRLTAKIKTDIIRCLSRRFHIGHTCAAFGISYESFRRARKLDPELERQVQNAKRLYTELIEGTIHNRAVEGWEEPVYGPVTKVYKDEDGNLVKESAHGVVGHVRKFDNKLLLALAKRFMPEWNPTQKIEQDTTVSTFQIDEKLTLEDLSADARKQLRDFLTKQKAEK